MQDGKFWRFAAVLMIVAVLYVGHGLHNGGTEGIVSLVGTAQAGGIATPTLRQFQCVYTASEDGRRLYLWRTVDGGSKT